MPTFVRASAERAVADPAARYDVEFRFRRADTGKERWMVGRGEVERDAAGRPLRMVGVTMDITDRRQAAAALAESEARVERAKELYEQAAQAYAARKNFEAIELFRQSGALEPSPLLSYNMALAYEEAGDLRNALKHFREYASAGNPDAAEEVETRIAKLESKLMGWASGNLDDIRAHLGSLVQPGFLRETPPALLAEFPRYLRGLALRAERPVLAGLVLALLALKPQWAILPGLFLLVSVGNVEVRSAKADQGCHRARRRRVPSHLQPATQCSAVIVQILRMHRVEKA